MNINEASQKCKGPHLGIKDADKKNAHNLNMPVLEKLLVGSE